jgi:hypothetical protein
LRGDDHDGIVTHGRSKELRMHMENPAQTGSDCIRFNDLKVENATSPSLLQGKHLPFSSSPFLLNIFHLFVTLSLTQLYRYTPEIFLFSTATFKYTYRAPLRRIGQEYSANVAFSTFKSLKRIQLLKIKIHVYFLSEHFEFHHFRPHFGIFLIWMSIPYLAI